MHFDPFKSDRALLRALRLIRDNAKRPAMAGATLSAFDQFQRGSVNGNVSEAGNIARTLLLSTAPDGARVVACLTALSVAGLSQSAAFVCHVFGPELRGHPLEELLRLIPNSAAWAAILKGASTLTSALLAIAKEDPHRVYETPAADWLAAHGKLADVTGLLELILRAVTRKAPLAPARGLLHAAFKRDKKATAAITLAKIIATDPVAMTHLAHAVLANKLPREGLINALAKGLPKLQVGDPLFVLTSRLLEALASSQAPCDASSSAFVMRLASFLPAARETAAASRLAEDITIVSRMWHAQSSTLEATVSLWAPSPLSETPTRASGNDLSRMGARHFAAAWEGLATGSQPRNVLLALGLNLGLTALGTVADHTAFDPLRHQDLQGGLNRGDSCTIAEAGWIFQGEILLRARVRRTND